MHIHQNDDISIFINYILIEIYIYIDVDKNLELIIKNFEVIFKCYITNHPNLTFVNTFLYHL